MPLTARAQRVYDLLNGRRGITRIEGQVEPRNIAGSSKLSEHTWGNALDIYGSLDALLYNAKYLDDNRDEYNIKVLCYDPGLGRKYDTCTTKHTDHIHVDFGPHCSGNVPATGNATERTNGCNQYQGGQVPDSNYPAGTAGNLWDSLTGAVSGMNPVNAITAVVQDIAGKAFLIGIGAVLVIGGLVLVVKDTAIGKAAIGATKTIATKGVIK